MLRVLAYGKSARHGPTCRGSVSQQVPTMPPRGRERKRERESETETETEREGGAEVPAARGKAGGRGGAHEGATGYFYVPFKKLSILYFRSALFL